MIYFILFRSSINPTLLLGLYIKQHFYKKKKIWKDILFINIYKILLTKLIMCVFRDKLYKLVHKL